MRRTHPSAVSSLALLLLAGVAAAAPEPRDPQGQMDEILFLSGLEEQLDLLGDGLGAALGPQLRSMPGPAREALQRAILAQFDGQTLRRGVEARLARAHDPRHAEAVLTWLRSPTGRRISRLEIDAARPEAGAALQAYLQRAMRGEDETSPARRVLMRSLDAATGMTDFTLEVTMATALATASGMNATLPAESRADADELSRSVQAGRDAMRPQLAQMTELSMLFTYRELTDGEIEQYIAFAHSEAGAWYHGAVKRALLDALVEASERVGQSVAQELQAAGGRPASPAH